MGRGGLDGKESCPKSVFKMVRCFYKLAGDDMYRDGRQPGCRVPAGFTDGTPRLHPRLFHHNPTLHPTCPFRGRLAAPSRRENAQNAGGTLPLDNQPQRRNTLSNSQQLGFDLCVHRLRGRGWENTANAAAGAACSLLLLLSTVPPTF